MPVPTSLHGDHVVRPGPLATVFRLPLRAHRLPGELVEAEELGLPGRRGRTNHHAAGAPAPAQEAAAGPRGAGRFRLRDVARYDGEVGGRRRRRRRRGRGRGRAIVGLLRGAAEAVERSVWHLGAHGALGQRSRPRVHGPPSCHADLDQVERDCEEECGEEAYREDRSATYAGDRAGALAGGAEREGGTSDAGAAGADEQSDLQRHVVLHRGVLRGR
mmetsp:Transcript_52655/g.170026  ORF Transcript_52655/g.170026 Transcript_52655/m.170026 type:complete len:217 (-) Transcript_52655:1526-2176(-)